MHVQIISNKMILFWVLICFILFIHRQFCHTNRTLGLFSEIAQISSQLNVRWIQNFLCITLCPTTLVKSLPSSRMASVSRDYGYLWWSERCRYGGGILSYFIDSPISSQDACVIPRHGLPITAWMHAYCSLDAIQYNLKYNLILHQFLDLGGIISHFCLR